MTNATAENETETQAEGRVSMVVISTPQFKVAMEQAAKAADTSLSQFAREILAKEIGFTGPLGMDKARPRKYATQEEREAAAKAKAKERRDLMKNLLEQYRQNQSQAAATNGGKSK